MNVRSARLSAPPAFEAIAPYSWAILGVSLLVQCAVTLPSQSIAPLAPFLQDAFGISRAEIGLLSTAGIVGALISMPIAGRLGDRAGVRRMYVVGLILVGASLALAGFAGHYPVLVAALGLTGLGLGVSVPATTRAVMFWFPRRVRAVAMSVKQTGLPLSGTLAGVTLPLIATGAGWAGGFFAMAAFAGVATIVALAGYRESPGEIHAQGAGRAAAGGVADLLRQRAFVVLSLTSTLFSVAHISTVTFLVLFLRESIGLDPIVAGGLFALAQVSAVVSRIGWGLLSDFAFGGRRKIVLVIIGSGAVLSLIGLAWLPPDPPGWALNALLLMTGATLFGWNGINMTFVAEIAGRDRSATAAGLSQAMTIVGTAIGPPLVGLLVDRTRSYPLAFQILAGMMVVAVALLSFVRPRPAQP